MAFPFRIHFELSDAVNALTHSDWIVHGSRWEDVVDTTYCLHLNDHRPVISAVDKEAVDRLREPPAGWSMNHDEELAQFLCGETFSQSDVAGNLGCIRDYVESIAVSSYSVSHTPCPSVAPLMASVYATPSLFIALPH